MTCRIPIMCAHVCASVCVPVCVCVCVCVCGVCVLTDNLCGCVCVTTSSLFMHYALPRTLMFSLQAPVTIILYIRRLVWHSARLVFKVLMHFLYIQCELSLIYCTGTLTTTKGSLSTLSLLNCLKTPLPSWLGQKETKALLPKQMFLERRWKKELLFIKTCRCCTAVRRKYASKNLSTIIIYSLHLAEHTVNYIICIVYIRAPACHDVISNQCFFV